MKGLAVLPSIFTDSDKNKYTMDIDYLVLNSTNKFAGILGADIFRCKNSIHMNFCNKHWEVEIDKVIKYFPLYSFEKSILINLVCPKKVTL